MGSPGSGRNSVSISIVATGILSMAALLSAAMPVSVYAETDIGGTIASSTTWGPSGNPYVIRSAVTVPTSTTLTIAPGTIVKSFEYGITVSGSLIVGEKDGEPVIFTSMKDDSIAGDTNGDATSTQPAVGDWGPIEAIEGGSIVMRNVQVRYGGQKIYLPAHYANTYSSILSDGGSVLLDGVEIADSSYGFDQLGRDATSTILHSSFHNIVGGNAIFLYATGPATILDSSFTNAWTGIYADAVGTVHIGGDVFDTQTAEAVFITGGSIVNDGNNTGNGLIMLRAFKDDTNNVLPSDGLPYEFSSESDIPAHASVTIQAGSTIQMLEEMHVEGLLKVDGNSEHPVIFTADTAENVAEAAGAWESIIVEPGGTANFHYAHILYGGARTNIKSSSYWAAVLNNGGTVSIDHSQIAHSVQTGLEQIAGTSTVSHTIFSDLSEGIWNHAGAMTAHENSFDGISWGMQANGIDATENWWGDPSGPHNATSNPDGKGAEAYGDFTFKPWLKCDPNATSTTCSEKPTILFIPGIEASDLYDSNGQLWLPGSDADAEQLFMNPDGTSKRDDIYTKGAIKKAYGLIDIYGSFLNNLDTWKNDDHVIADYAVAPYDWRLSLNEILSRGRKFPDGSIHYVGGAGATSTPYILQELRRLSQEGNGKVTIVAHSNGGLVAKALLQQLNDNNDPLLGHIDKLILVAVPQTGTPYAIGAALHGFGTSLPPDPIPFKFFLSEPTSREFAISDPMVYHLLPSTAYFHGLGGDVFTPVVTFENGTTTSSFIKTYGRSITDEQTLREFLLGEDGRVQPAKGDLIHPSVLYSNLLDYGASVHQSIDSWSPPSSMQVYEIAGWGNDTLAGITYSDERYCATLLPTIPITCTKYGTKFMYSPNTVEDGDGTVVVPSALAISTSSPNVTRLWLDLNQYNENHQLQDGLINRQHFDILTVLSLREQIRNIVSASASTSSEYLSYSEPPPITEKRLHFILHSPLDLSVTDASGDIVSSSTSAIPGAEYKRFGEVQYISVPASADPSLHLTGEKSGSFTLEVQEARGDTTIATTTFMGIPTATTTTAQMSFSDGTIANASPLKVDTDGDGKNDLSLAPKIGETVLPDYTPPEFTVTFSTSTHSLAFIATDNSGTTTTEVNAPTKDKHAGRDFGFVINRKERGKGIDDDMVIIAKDLSGNTTVLTYQQSRVDFGLHMGTVTLKSINYNGATSILDNVSIAYVWNRNNSRNSKQSLEITIHNGATTTTAIYDSHKNETVITTFVPAEIPKMFGSFLGNVLNGKRAQWSKSLPQVQHFPGIVIPEIKTRNGRAMVIY